MHHFYELDRPFFLTQQTLRSDIYIIIVEKSQWL